MRYALLIALLLAPRETILRVAWGPPTQLDPQKALSQIDGRYVSALFEGLVTPGPDGITPSPGVAETWDASEDGLAWTFRLRAESWSDGRPVTAGDFVYAWRRALNPATGCEYGSLFRIMKHVGAYLEAAEADALLAQYEDLTRAAQAQSMARLGEIARHRHAPALRRRGNETAAQAAEARPEIEEKDLGFEAVDARTLRITLERPAPWLPDTLSFMCFAPVPERAIAAHGERWVLPGQIVTNGPYLFDSASTASFIFRKNRAYWDRTLEAAPDRVAVEFSTDVAALEKFQGGKLQWVAREQIPPEKLADLKAAVRYDTWGTFFLTLNTTRPPFDRKELRVAFARGVDRSAIAAAAAASPTDRLVPAGFPGYPAVAGLPYDKAAAMEALLRESGFDITKLPRFEILTSDAPLAMAAGEIVREHLEKTFALKGRVQSLKWPSYVRVLGAGDYQVALTAWAGDAFDPVTFLEGWTKGHPRNTSGWSDEGYDRLLRAAASKTGPDRLKDLAQAEGILLSGAPVVPLYAMRDVYLASDRVRGLRPNLLGRFPLKYLRLE
ncbi:MAG TPA: peptide ABC transporter substrate-binding protein [Planctomycetota bacterium]|nr:peptide ABC transporter substrate-binding protein [Planctomycetota bacterium]